MQTRESGAVIAALRPAAGDIDRYHAAGLWRATTFVDDLRHWAASMPDAPAIAADGHTITYAGYAARVESFAGSLAALGVRPGEVVAVRLPNRWETNALILACARAGAIVARS